MCQIESVPQLIDAMQVKHRGSWFKEFTFTQETIRYNQNGAVRDTAIWYEAVSYPDFFRIDYNQEGRFVIFRNDSAYRYDDYKLERSSVQAQEFLLFKGGMYYRPQNSILDKLKAYGYNTDEIRYDNLNGRKTIVVGAKAGDLDTKQFWVDADHYYTVRRISKTGNSQILDVIYSDHKRVNGGWVEQVVTFYLDGRLLQVENYLDIESGEVLDAKIFDPKRPLKSWFK